MSNIGSVVASVVVRTVGAGLVLSIGLAFTERPIRLPGLAAPATDIDQLAFDPIETRGQDRPIDRTGGGAADEGRTETAPAGSAGADGSALVGEEVLAQPEIGYGTSPALDLLWDACEAGNGVACDQLFAQAPLGSAYEQFGLTCGDRPLVLDCATDLVILEAAEGISAVATSGEGE
ncbi:MAG: hypothetical protein AAF467_07890 [Actinomycetota bacterium]